MDSAEQKKRGEEQVTIFSDAMLHELVKNAHKGDWLLNEETGQPITDETLLHELLYHASKLAAAMAKGNKEAILHYSADVGNCAWFIANKHEALDRGLLTDAVIEYGDEPVDTPEGFMQKKQRAMDLAQEMLADVPESDKLKDVL